MRVAFVPLATFCTFQLFCLFPPFPATVSLSTMCPPPASRNAVEATQVHRPSPLFRAGLHTLKNLTFSIHLFDSGKVTLSVSGHQMRYLGQMQQNPSLVSSSRVFNIEQ